MCLSPHFALAVEASPGGTVGEFYNPSFHSSLSYGFKWWGGRNYSVKLGPFHTTQLLFFIEIYFWEYMLLSITMGCAWGMGEERIGDEIPECSNAVCWNRWPENCWLEARPQLLSAGLTDAETSPNLGPGVTQVHQWTVVSILIRRRKCAQIWKII